MEKQIKLELVNSNSEIKEFTLYEFQGDIEHSEKMSFDGLDLGTISQSDEVFCVSRH